MMPIAGIGASAGGLEAMLLMCSRLRPTGRIAYVIAQHMAHNGHSELVARLIQRESALPVILVDKTLRLQADTVYMIPAGKDGQVRSDMLSLSEPASGSISTPSANVLFQSIAESCGSNAIGARTAGLDEHGIGRSIREEWMRAEAVKDFSPYKEPPGGDQIMLRKNSGGAWGEPIAITKPGGDFYRPAVAVDGSGRPWVHLAAS